MRTFLRRAVVLTSAVMTAVYILLLVDWRGRPDPSPPIVRRAFEVAAPLSAGAARVRLDPPLPVVRAGYGPRKAVAVVERDPLEVRALVLHAGRRRVALVLVDLVLVTEELTRGLEARLADLGLDGVVFVATHTHSSVGGFDPDVLAQVVGTGRYRADMVDVVIDRSEAAVRTAAGRVAPVRIRTGETRLAGWAENRSTPGAPIDDRLTVVALTREDGQAVAVLGVVAAHPTLLSRTAPELSGDYPGEAMRRLAPAGRAAFLLQGAEGDARPPGSGVAAIASDGRFVAERMADTLATATDTAGRLGLADVGIRLPRAEPQGLRSFFTRRPASNVIEWMVPHAAPVTVLTIGDLTFLGVPGEPTALAAERILAALPSAPLSGRRVRVIGLARGYVGYVDTPERARAGQGEARRAWFGPDLLETVTRGLQAGVSAPRGE